MTKRTINVASWVEAATSKPVEHRRRQVVEILLDSIGRSPELRGVLYLKGGALLNLAHQSPRMTADVDFTTKQEPEGFAEFIKVKLDAAMRLSAVTLGYLNLVFQVQSSETRPPLESSSWPTLRLKIGIAEKGSSQEELLKVGQAVEVLRVDISFNEPVIEVDELIFEDHDISVFSYSINETIAEKLRAMLQQEVRNRYRGQDIYDISILIRNYPRSEHDKEKILEILKVKADARKLTVGPTSLNDAEIVNRLQKRYQEMRFEVDEAELDFGKDLTAVQEFYKSLPWKS